MRARSRTRPASTLPALHPPQLSFTPLLQQYHAIDLTVGMSVILAAVFVQGFHVHGGDGDVVRFRGRRSDAAAPVFGAVELVLGDPAFLEAGKDGGSEGLVVGCSRAVGCV